MEASEIEKLVSNLLSFLTIDNLFSRLTHTEKVTEFSILLDRTDITEEKLGALKEAAKTAAPPAYLYILCFSFLVALEGYYDELVRFMYAVEQLLATGTVQDPDLLKYASVDSMEDSMPAPPEAIFEIWESGRSIRNAIAHRRFYYSAKDETFRFVVIDWKKRRVKFDKRITVAEVRRLYEKIGVVGAALRVLLLLLVIYSLLVIPADRILGIPQRALRFRTSSCTV